MDLMTYQRAQTYREELVGNFDAASAAYRMGYNDVAYFSREYKSLFGVPPRDVQQLREVAPANLSRSS